jgi:hypothetical protein
MRHPRRLLLILVLLFLSACTTLPPTMVKDEVKENYSLYDPQFFKRGDELVVDIKIRKDYQEVNKLKTCTKVHTMTAGLLYEMGSEPAIFFALPVFLPIGMTVDAISFIFLSPLDREYCDFEEKSRIPKITYGSFDGYFSGGIKVVGVETGTTLADRILTKHSLHEFRLPVGREDNLIVHLKGDVQLKGKTHSVNKQSVVSGDIGR